MNIDLNLVDQQVQAIAQRNENLDKDAEKRISKAFTLLCLKSVLDIDNEEEAREYMFDGSGDFGIDGLFIGDIQDDEFEVKIFQTKYKRLQKNSDSLYDGRSHFKTTDVQKMIGIVSDIFNFSADIPGKQEIIDKIAEIRSIIANEGAIPNIEVLFCMNGLGLGEEGKVCWNNNFKDESKRVSYRDITHTSIVKMLEKKAVIKDSLKFSGKILYDDSFGFKRVFIGKVNVAELARLFDKYGDRLLEKNVRKFLGTKNTVNEQIQKTILDEKENANFFFLNNGITITATDVKHSSLMEGFFQVKMVNINIINGGQTCKTIQETLANNSDLDTTRCYVLVRIYELEQDEELLMDRITLATNSQSVVDLKDLKSNDPIQEKLVNAVSLLDSDGGKPRFEYKPKKDSLINNQAITIGVAAEAIFSTWNDMPHQAKFHKNRMFSLGYYEKIFNDNLNAAQLVMAVLIWRYIETRRKGDAEIREKYYFVNYASNLIAMIMGKLILRKYNMDLSKLTHLNFKNIEQQFEQDKKELYNKALDIVAESLNKICLDKANLYRISAAFRREELTSIARKKIDEIQYEQGA